jgi:hypothetical protein
LNRIFDGLDGIVARIHKKQTKFGGVLDLYIDFIVTSKLTKNLSTGLWDCTNWSGDEL